MQPVVIKLQAEGVEKVTQAFKTLQKTLIDIESSISRIQSKESKERIKVGDREAKEREKGAKAAVKAVELSERAATKAADKEAKEREKIASRETKTKEKEAKKAADTAIREAKRASDEAERLAKRSAEARKRTFDKIGGSVSGAVAGAVGGAGRLLGAATALGGGFTIADSVRDQLSLEKAVTLAVNASRDAKTGKTIDRKALEGSIRGASLATGMSQTDLAVGFKTFQDKSGDAEMGMKLLPFLSKMSSTYGSDINELANVAGTFSSQNPNIKSEDIQRLMLNLTEQGKAGAVDMKDLAKYIPGISAQASLFKGGGSYVDKVSHLAGIAQLTQTVTKDPAEATNAVKRFATELSLADSKGTLGFKGATAMDPVQAMLKVYGQATLGSKDGSMNLAKLEKMGFTDEGRKVLMGVSSVASLARQEGTGNGLKGKELEAFVAKSLTDRVAKLAGVSDKETQGKMFDADSGEAAKSTAVQLEKAFNDLKITAGEVFLPAFKDVAQAFGEHKEDLKAFIKSLAELAKWAISHPWSALFAGIGASIAKTLLTELVTAGIGKAVSGALSGLLGGAGGGGVPGGGAAGGALGGAGGGVGAALGVVAAGAGGFMLGKEIAQGDNAFGNFIDNLAGYDKNILTEDDKKKKALNDELSGPLGLDTPSYYSMGDSLPSRNSKKKGIITEVDTGTEYINKKDVKPQSITTPVIKVDNLIINGVSPRGGPIIAR